MTRRVRPPIVIDGATVLPDELERVLLSLRGVREAVVLRADALGGQPAVKVVVVAPGLERAEIESWCGRALPDLRGAIHVEVLDTLPRSPAGKVLQKYM